MFTLKILQHLMSVGTDYGFSLVICSSLIIRGKHFQMVLILFLSKR